MLDEALRSPDARDFITLPPLGEAGTLTLIDELEAVLKSTSSAPEDVVAAMQRLLEASATLQKDIATRERAGSSADPRARAADRAVDDAWGAFQHWLLGWTRLPEGAHPLLADARGIYAALFPKGLQFLMLDFKDQWNESKQRLDHLREGDLESIVTQLGGEAFLEVLHECHLKYGEALQITARRGGGPPEADALVRHSLDASHMALREYVAQVAVTVRRTHQDSIERARVLLLPLSIRAGA